MSHIPLLRNWIELSISITTNECFRLKKKYSKIENKSDLSNFVENSPNSRSNQKNWC